jgi:cytochrome c-type biogenesis protein CcmH
MKRNIWIFFVVTFLGLVWVGQVSAQGPLPSDDQVNAVAKQLFCPVCESTPLDVCSTQACAEWRELIRTKLAEGQTPDQIKDYFAAQYGVRVLAEPPKRGFTWWIYIIPPVLMLIGVYVLVRALQSMRKPVVESDTTEETEQPGPVQDDYLRRVEEEIKKRN